MDQVNTESSAADILRDNGKSVRHVGEFTTTAGATPLYAEPDWVLACNGKTPRPS